jgi:hypothetical protein
MKPIKHYPKMLVIIFLSSILMLSCSPTHFLRVQYQLPSSTDSMQGMDVSFAYKDMRINKNNTTQSAKEELKDFSGEFTLVVAQGPDGGKLLGAFDLPSMLKEIFKQRLENSGINVRGEAYPDNQVEFILKEFLLDYKDRKWIMTMSYELNLIKSGETVITETVSGQAERLKVIGGKEAERVMSELITDMVNKIDLQQFFKGKK